MADKLDPCNQATRYQQGTRSVCVRVCVCVRRYFSLEFSRTKSQAELRSGGKGLICLAKLCQPLLVGVEGLLIIQACGVFGPQ